MFIPGPTQSGWTSQQKPHRLCDTETWTNKVDTKKQHNQPAGFYFLFYTCLYNRYAIANISVGGCEPNSEMFVSLWWSWSIPLAWLPWICISCNSCISCTINHSTTKPSPNMFHVGGTVAQQQEHQLPLWLWLAFCGLVCLQYLVDGPVLMLVLKAKMLKHIHCLHALVSFIIVVV